MLRGDFFVCIACVTWPPVSSGPCRTDAVPVPVSGAGPPSGVPPLWLSLSDEFYEGNQVGRYGIWRLSSSGTTKKLLDVR